MSISNLTITGDADSKDFALEDTTKASSTTEIFSSESDAAEGLKEQATGMEGSDVEDCFRKLFADQISEGDKVEIDSVDVGELNVTAPDGVDETKAWQVAIGLTGTSGEAKGTSVTAYVDLAEVRVGDAISVLNTSDVLTPFDSDLRDQLLKTLAGRLTANDVE